MSKGCGSDVDTTTETALDPGVVAGVVAMVVVTAVVVTAVVVTAVVVTAVMATSFVVAVVAVVA